MRNHLMPSIVTVAILAFSPAMFAQTYGTGGYVPGAWQPSDLPKDLPKAKPFDPHNLSGVWVATAEGEPHSLNGAGTKHNSPPPMTTAGKARFDANLPSKGPRAVIAGLGNSPVSTCDPLGYPMSLWAANLSRDRCDQSSERSDAGGWILQKVITVVKGKVVVIGAAGKWDRSCDFQGRFGPGFPTRSAHNKRGERGLHLGVDVRPRELAGAVGWSGEAMTKRLLD